MPSLQMLNDAFANPMFLGIVTAGALGGGLVVLRKLPDTLYSLAKRYMMVSVSVRGNQYSYDYINTWIAKRPFSRKAHRLQLVEVNDEDGEKKSFDFTLGTGQHLVRHDGRFLWINRMRNEKTISNGQKNNAETLEITTFGRSQVALRTIINEACSEYNDGSNVRVYMWDDGYFKVADIKTKRSLGSIFLPEDQKQRLVDDLELFYAKRTVYAARGTPWRRGYLLRGQPGTGKTSLIFALASHFDKPIYIINLANVGGDQELLNAMNSAGSAGFILTEDIDGVDVTHQRSETGINNTNNDSMDKGRLTLAGILNAVDGIASREGRVLFVTSNHAEKLDTALIRPGRIDCDETIGPLGVEDARRMAAAFDPAMSDAMFHSLVGAKLPLPASTVQDLLVKYENSFPHVVPRADNDAGPQDVAA